MSQTGKQEIALPSDLDWVQIRENYENSVLPETTKEKMLRKIKQNPFVPIGCLATAGALSYGLYSFRTGNRRMSQLMMRTRIAAQALTVAALVIGVLATYGPTKAVPSAAATDAKD